MYAEFNSGHEIRQQRK